MTLTWTDSLSSLVRGATPRTPAARSRTCSRTGRSSIEACGSPHAMCGGDLESHYRGPGRALRRVAPGVVSCSVVHFDPSGRGSPAMGQADIEGGGAAV